MNVVELKNVEREDGFIYYMRKYTADAVIKLPTETTETPIKFCIETDPLGQKHIDLELLTQPNYPALPIISSLKVFIMAQDNNGILPI